MKEIKFSREEIYSPLKSKGFLHEWAKEILDIFPAINEIITESKLRELGVQLLMKQKISTEKLNEEALQQIANEIHWKITHYGLFGGADYLAQWLRGIGIEVPPLPYEKEPFPEKEKS